jgi:hypothetical protein
VTDVIGKEKEPFTLNVELFAVAVAAGGVLVTVIALLLGPQMFHFQLQEAYC